MNLFLVIILVFCWSPSFIFIKLSLDSFSPISIGFLRAFIALVIVFFTCKYKKINLLDYTKDLRKFIFMGLLVNGIPYILVNFAEEKISTFLTAILLGLVPLITLLISPLYFPKEKISKKTIFWFFLAFLGLIIINLSNIYEGRISDEIGVLLILTSAIFYANGSAFAKKYLQQFPSLVSAFYQLLATTCFLGPYALVYESPFAQPVSWKSLIGITCLGVVCTAIPSSFYYKSIQRNGSHFTSLNNLIIPIVSSMLGMIFLGESVSFFVAIGGIMVFFSVYKIQYDKKLVLEKKA